MNIHGSLKLHCYKCDLCWLWLLGAEGTKEEFTWISFPTKGSTLALLTQSRCSSRQKPARAGSACRGFAPHCSIAAMLWEKLSEGDTGLSFSTLGLLLVWWTGQGSGAPCAHPTRHPWAMSLGGTCVRTAELRSVCPCAPVHDTCPVFQGDVTRQGSPSKGRRWKCCRVELLHRGGLVPRMFVCRMPYCMLEEPCILNKYENNAVVLLFNFFSQLLF